MTADADDLSGGRGAKLRFGRGALYAFLAGLGATVAAGLALWSQQGAEVFLAQAFAALAACF